jgi:hypothetical protein
MLSSQGRMKYLRPLYRCVHMHLQVAMLPHACPVTSCLPCSNHSKGHLVFDGESAVQQKLLAAQCNLQRKSWHAGCHCEDLKHSSA